MFIHQQYSHLIMRIALYFLLSTVVKQQFTLPSLHLLCQRQLHEHGNCIDLFHHRPMRPWKANHANLPGRPCTGKVANWFRCTFPPQNKRVKANANPQDWNLNYRWSFSTLKRDQTAPIFCHDTARRTLAKEDSWVWWTNVKMYGKHWHSLGFSLQKVS